MSIIDSVCDTIIHKSGETIIETLLINFSDFLGWVVQTVAESIGILMAVETIITSVILMWLIFREIFHESIDVKVILMRHLEVMDEIIIPVVFNGDAWLTVLVWVFLFLASVGVEACVVEVEHATTRVEVWLPWIA